MNQDFIWLLHWTWSMYISKSTPIIFPKMDGKKNQVNLMWNVCSLKKNAVLLLLAVTVQQQVLNLNLFSIFSCFFFLLFTVEKFQSTQNECDHQFSSTLSILSEYFLIWINKFFSLNLICKLNVINCYVQLMNIYFVTDVRNNFISSN